eukprot:1142631-Pelagomonas_calceolata.AAC.1
MHSSGAAFTSSLTSSSLSSSSSSAAAAAGQRTGQNVKDGNQELLFFKHFAVIRDGPLALNPCCQQPIHLPLLETNAAAPCMQIQDLKKGTNLIKVMEEEKIKWREGKKKKGRKMEKRKDRKGKKEE